ncbi:MAG: cyclodeaminase/cyclohydrolase family protein [Planctomycetes bacterium]|nr:cyclodeaminase/cyclohydrolase family protein [Planctomycetota bacterium]
MNEQQNPFSRLDPFLDALKSDAPTPGGGAVAGLLGALAAALAHMVASLTVGKKKYEGVEARFRSAMPAMDAAIARCRELVEEDVRVFQDYMAALKLPKASDEEKAARRDAIRAAAREAARVPMETLDAAGEILPLARLAADEGNAHAISDAGISAILIAAAARAAALNVRINLPALADDEAAALRERMESRLAAIVTEAAAIEARVTAAL